MNLLPQLSRAVAEPAEWPEKILQFGTGRFLRAFADHFVDAANRQGRFRGSVVVVQSTGSGRAEALSRQDGLYTLWIRGLKDGSPFESQRILTAISRALPARERWDDVLGVARSPDLEIVVSNTTEIGPVFDAEDSMTGGAPRSFPGKLTAVLSERARAFDYATEAGLVMLPCELLSDNGHTLRRLVLRQAQAWQLGGAFENWIETACTFCNTLVDRIVPGAPPEPDIRAFEERAGYRDEMLTVAEDYRLWAIEGDKALTRRIGFADSDPGIIVAPDIAAYRTRKIRILNGGHTLSVPVGILAGNVTVLDNVSSPRTRPYIEDLLRREIGPTLEVDPQTVTPYIDEVLGRWRNPFLVHRLLDITLHGTRKMRVRAIPSLLAFHAAFGRVPRRIALGFAAHLLFMRGVEERGGRIYGELRGDPYPIDDAKAAEFRRWWKAARTPRDLVDRVCGNTALWGCDLRALGGFADAVTSLLQTAMHDGMDAALSSCLPAATPPRNRG